MKKVLFAALCFACLGISAVHAQKPKTGTGTEQSPTGDGSTTRTGKGVGKGSPLIQRNAAPGSSDDATQSRSTEASPAAPAATGSKTSASPAKNEVILRDSVSSQKTTLGTKPKEAASSK